MYRTLKMVVLDDDPSIVRLVKTILRGAFATQLEIVTFTDPFEAQQWMEEHNCDLLISDIEMPGISGLEMLVFAKRRNAWTQVMLLTGHSSWKHVTEALENGASDFLLKPVQRDDLCDVVQQQIDRADRWHQALFPTQPAPICGAIENQR